jgi:transcriptional regulator
LIFDIPNCEVAMASATSGATPDTEMLVLAVLGDGPAHGYAIAQAINRRTDGLLRMKEGTLYPLLHRLEADGLIRAEWRQSDKGPPRRTYDLRARGRRLLRKRAKEWRELSRAVDAVLGEAVNA